MAQPKTVRREGVTIHFSVGALIIKGSKILLIDRAQPPFGLAGPAGHIDEGEEPAAALKREVQEETGLSIQTCTLAGEEFIAWNTCSLGVKGHHWYVYRCSVEGELKRSQRETKSLGWYNLANVSGLEPVWEYWLKQLKLI